MVSRVTSSRRSFILGLAGAGLVGLTGCGGSSSQPNGMLPAYGATRDLAGARLEGLMRKSFIPEVNELLADVAAEWATASNAELELEFSDEWRERGAEAGESGAGPDVVELLGNAHLLAGALVDVSDVAAEVGARHGGWSPAAESAAVVDGVWRAIPWAYTAHAINARADMLDAAGASHPETYEDLLETATLLAEADLPRAGFSMGLDAPNDSSDLAYSMLWSFGGQEVDETTGRVALDSEATRAALSYWSELASVSEPAAVGFDEAANNEAFLAGTISLTQNASSIFWRAQAEVPEVADAMTHLRYPAGPAGYHQLVQMNQIGVFAHSPNRDAAMSWLRQATSADVMARRAITSLSFYSPPLADFADDPAMPWNTDERHAGLSPVGDSGHLAGWPGTNAEEAGIVYGNRSIVNMFASVSNRSLSVDEAVRTATEELRRVYET